VHYLALTPLGPGGNQKRQGYSSDRKHNRATRTKELHDMDKRRLLRANCQGTAAARK